MTYTYIYDPKAESEVNVSESMKVDKLRAVLAPTTEQLRARPYYWTVQLFEGRMQTK